MAKRILLVQGHPDPSRQHLCHTSEDAYADPAVIAGHEVRRARVAELNLPLLRTQDEWEHGKLPETLQRTGGCVRRPMRAVADCTATLTTVVPTFGV